MGKIVSFLKSIEKKMSFHDKLFYGLLFAYFLGCISGSLAVLPVLGKLQQCQQEKHSVSFKDENGNIVGTITELPK